MVARTNPKMLSMTQFQEVLMTTSTARKWKPILCQAEQMTPMRVKMGRDQRRRTDEGCRTQIGRTSNLCQCAVRTMTRQLEEESMSCS
jgi:hypothetical protein